MAIDFMLGCNYWDSASGTEMWKKWQPDVVKDDLEALEKCGVKYLRVFPLWRDFQPIKKLYNWRGGFGEYTVGEDDEYLDENPDGMDMTMIERFRSFADMAAEHGMKLIVSIVTGWMSGRLFVPPAIEGRNLIADSEVLMWTEKYVKAIVRNLRDKENIVMWDLGNECNCLGEAPTRAAAYVWTATVRNAIICEDTSRPISSGMHSLECNPNSIWQLCDQGSLCDFVTTHPYPSPTIKGDLEPYNGLRTTLLPTAQSEYYSGVSGVPCLIQESGTFSPTIGNAEMSADFARVNILSAWANGLYGYLWWCGMEHLNLKNPPYSWSMMERQLGMVDVNRNPKPVGMAIKKMSEALSALPPLSECKKRTDAVCILTREIDKQGIACAANILAKEAGFNIRIANCETILPESDMYLMPAAKGWQVTYRRTWDTVLDRVYTGGATLFATYDGGHFTQIEEIFGIKSHGVYKRNKSHTAHFPFGDICYTPSNDMIIESVGAEVLAANEDGNPVFTVNSFGKGKVYFLGFSPESAALNACCGFDADESESFYKIYAEVGKDIIGSYKVKSDNPYIGITEKYCDDGSLIVCAINYDKRPHEFSPTIDGDYELLYGALGEIPKCDGVILRFSKR